MSYQYTRITADEVQPGDEIARARSHTFQPVAAVHPGPATVRLIFGGGESIRPTRTARLWRRTVVTDAPNVREPEHLSAYRARRRRCRELAAARGPFEVPAVADEAARCRDMARDAYRPDAIDRAASFVPPAQEAETG